MKNTLLNTLGLGMALLIVAACSSTSTSPSGPTSDPAPTVREAPTVMESPTVREAPEVEETEQPEQQVIVTADFSPVQTEPILARGEEGEWDSVVMRFPYVVKSDGAYHLFYEARAVLGESFLAIGYAESEDGINWTKFEGNPIFEGDGTGFDSLSSGRPIVSVNEDGEWLMYYSADGRVGQATAPSPTGPWTRADEPLLANGPPGSWDHELLLLDQIVIVGDEQRLYYSGRAASGQSAMIGLAISTDGGRSWEKFNDPENDASETRFAESDPIISAGPGWDSRAAWTPSIWKNESGWVMMYNAFGSLGLAFSEDGISWNKYAENPVIRNSSIFHPFVVHNDDGTMLIYYRNLRNNALHLLEGTLIFE